MSQGQILKELGAEAMSYPRHFSLPLIHSCRGVVAGKDAFQLLGMFIDKMTKKDGVGGGQMGGGVRETTQVG